MVSQSGVRFTAAAVLFIALTGCSQTSGNSGGSSNTADKPATESANAAFTPLTATVLTAPQPVKATDGKFHLDYEIQVLNVLSQPMAIHSVRAVAGDKTLGDLSGPALTSSVRVYGAATPGGIAEGGPAFSKPPGAVLGPGQSALVWMDLVVASQADIPHEITHAIDIEVTEPSEPLIPRTLTENVAKIRLHNADPVVISSPLRGSHWLDGNSCCAITPHRTAVSPLNGQLFAPERYAIDFVQLSNNGTYFTGDKTKVNSYAYYGADIHAVADGAVVAVVNNLPEQVPGANPTGLKVNEYGGNYVVQYIGNGRYAFYAHLQPGDGVEVKVGEQLSKGQVIAKLGNSGNTDSPHLHFHVMDGPDPLAANGLPFVLDSFTLESQITADSLDAAADGKPVQYNPAVKSDKREDEFPLYLDVLGF